MGVSDRAAVLGFLRQNTGEGAELNIPEQRARMDALELVFPVPDGTEVEPATLGGVPGEWVRARRARGDAALLYLHGGGYVLGSPRSHRHLAAAIGEAAGVPLFVAEYRLAPEHPFPAAVEDAVAAYRGLLDMGLDPAKLAIAGDSAGGGLTIATLVALRDRNIRLPACAICISAWADLSQGGEAYRTRARRDPMIRKETLDGMAADYLAGQNPKVPLASPLFADLTGLPPLLLQVGTEEALHDDTTGLASCADAAGVEVSLETWGGMMHVWHFFHPMLSEGRDAISRIGAFVKARIA